MDETHDCENCRYRDRFIEIEPCKSCGDIEKPPYWKWEERSEEETMKQVYWIKVNGERYCSFENYEDASLMVRYLKARGSTDELIIEADAGKED